jgi:hypothetical protein
MQIPCDQPESKADGVDSSEYQSLLHPQASPLSSSSPLSFAENSRLPTFQGMGLEIGLIDILSRAIPQKWREEVRADNNMLFMNVDRPGLTLHAILPVWDLLVGHNFGNLPRKNVPFCRKDSGFADSLKQFQKVPQVQDQDLLLMLHLKNLYEDEPNRLRGFLGPRQSDLDDKSV